MLIQKVLRSPRIYVVRVYVWFLDCVCDTNIDCRPEFAADVLNASVNKTLIHER